MGICPNCGSWVDEGDICHGCGAVFGYGGGSYSESDILAMSCSAERDRKRGNLKSSIETYKEIIESLENVDSYSYDSFAQYHIQAAKDAIAEMKPEFEAVEDAEKKARELFDEAWSLYNENRLSEALYLINQATEIYPRVAGDFNRKALILDSMERYEEASYYYDKASSLKPYDEVFLKNKALMLSDWADQLLENSKGLSHRWSMLNEAYEKIKTAIETLPENNDKKLDSLKQQKKSIEFYMDLEKDFQKKLETIGLYEKDMLFTITGRDFYENDVRIYMGLNLKLVKEPSNKYDSDAIAVYANDKKIGYVANSDYTIYEQTYSASELQDKIGPVTKGKYITDLSKYGEVTYHIGRIPL